MLTKMIAAYLFSCLSQDSHFDEFYCLPELIWYRNYFSRIEFLLRMRAGYLISCHIERQEFVLKNDITLNVLDIKLRIRMPSIASV